MAEQVDAWDLKSHVQKWTYGFDPRSWYNKLTSCKAHEIARIETSLQLSVNPNRLVGK